MHCKQTPLDDIEYEVQIMKLESLESNLETNKIRLDLLSFHTN